MRALSTAARLTARRRANVMTHSSPLPSAGLNRDADRQTSSKTPAASCSAWD